MTAGVVYLRREPHDSSAFSTSSSGGSEKSHDRSSFLRRIFRNRARSAEYLPRIADEEFGEDGLDTMVMMPSPHTHPLLSKPYARDEFRLRRRRHHQTLYDGSGTRKPKLRVGSALSTSGGDNNGTAADLYRRSLREREKLAMAAAADPRYVQEWGFFIKCYAEGRFNLSNPPDPPPRRSDFNHLVAPAPPNERQRLKAMKACNITLSTLAQQKCHRLVLLARKVFQTRMATISLIDEDLEVVKAEHSFGRTFLPRSHSISAHVLLGSETMVVLDTVKDWRLRGNPLTQDTPHLRFYAGAPIVNFDGHIIGVFAVFDTQPRSTFPAASRRNLMDFARLAMTEFEMAMEERDDVRRSRITSTEPDAVSFISRRGRLSQKLLQGIEENAEKMPSSPSVYLPGETSEELMDSPTVPERPQDSMVARRRTLPEPVAVPSTASSTLTKVVTPQPQPFPPPRTSSRGAPSTSHSAHPSISHSQRASISALPSSRGGVMVQSTPRYKQHRPLPIFTTPHQRNPSTPITPRIPASPGSITSMVEATYATSLIARSLDYDFVYLLRVTSFPAGGNDSPLVPKDPYKEKVAVTTRVLVAHGLPDPPPIFDASLHLRALKSVGGLIFQNPVGEDSDRDDVGYQLGILLPLARDCGEGVGVPAPEGAKCVGGIVLAAFARKACEEPAFRADEVRFLREFGEAMRDILIKADRGLKKTPPEVI